MSSPDASKHCLTWGDVFSSPSMVGSSEYATICELCANVADIDNICGEVSPDTPLDEEAIDQMKSALGELIQYANDTLNTLK